MRTIALPVSRHPPAERSFLRAKEAGGLLTDHIAAEIGQVLAGKIERCRPPGEITVYKSIGHVVQDLASVWSSTRNPGST